MNVPRRIDDDLLELILAHDHCASLALWPRKPPFSRALQLCAVDRQWRSIVLGRGLFWSHIFCGRDVSFEAVSVQLERAGNAPLVVHIRLTRLNSVLGITTLTRVRRVKSDWQPAANFLLSKINRIDSLEIDTPGWLSISVPDTAIALSIPRQDLPLRRLSPRKIALASASPCFKGEVLLALTGPCTNKLAISHEAITFAELQRVLLQTPNLRSLSLNTVWFAENHDPDPALYPRSGGPILDLLELRIDQDERAFDFWKHQLQASLQHGRCLIIDGSNEKQITDNALRFLHAHMPRPALKLSIGTDPAYSDDYVMEYTNGKQRILRRPYQKRRRASTIHALARTMLAPELGIQTLALGLDLSAPLSETLPRKLVVLQLADPAAIAQIFRLELHVSAAAREAAWTEEAHQVLVPPFQLPSLEQITLVVSRGKDPGGSDPTQLVGVVETSVRLLKCFETSGPVQLIVEGWGSDEMATAINHVASWNTAFITRT